MTGTPSGTTTAYDNGNTRCSFDEDASLRELSSKPRGYVGRKLNAKLRFEEHEPHMRQRKGGQGHVGVQNPKVIQAPSCICGEYVERRSHVLPREICLSVWSEESEGGCGSSRKRSPGRLGGTPQQRSERRANAKSESKLGKPRGERWTGRNQQNP